MISRINNDLPMNDSNEGSILVVVAHPDDETLGAGGTIRQHVGQGIPVDVQCMTGNENRNTELRNACNVLGIRHLYLSIRDDFSIGRSLTNETIAVILKSRPSVVITHSDEDYNKNHVECSQIVEEAVEWASHATVFDNAHRVQRVYHMEVNNLLSRPHVHVDITDSYSAAIKALKEHKSQVPKSDQYYLKLYDARTRLRGVQAACERAEAFRVVVPMHAGPFYTRNSVDRLI
ncbi:MAG: PIG-L deacetylase family protein [Candidatus Thorarchaeota archaeon]